MDTNLVEQIIGSVLATTSLEGALVAANARIEEGNLARSLDMPERIRLVPVAMGLHTLTIAACVGPRRQASGINLPATRITVWPGAADASLEIHGTVESAPGWLDAAGGTIIVKVSHGHSTVIVTTYGLAANAALPSIETVRLWPVLEPRVPEPPPSGMAGPAGYSVDAAITLHIARLGDCVFPAVDWAGDPNRASHIEGIAITPTELLVPGEIEYAAFALNGARTPWVSGSRLAGTRGYGIPLAGFAVRLAPSLRGRFDAIYEGVSLSGETAGPCRNGEPCLSSGGSPLTAIRVNIVARATGSEMEAITPFDRDNGPAANDDRPVPIDSAGPAEARTGSEGGADVQGPIPAVETHTLDPALQAIHYDMAIVKEHFDPLYYLGILGESPTKAEIRDIGLLEHYCAFGWKEGRDPSAWFSVEQYLLVHMDVADAGWNPLVHYILYGKDEGRSIAPGRPPRSLEREAITAELEAVRDELAAARAVGRALMASLRESLLPATAPTSWGWFTWVHRRIRARE